MPKIDAKALYWNMMRNSREHDPVMWPAVRRLRESGRFVIAALSNTTKNDGVRDEKGELFRSRDVRNDFDVFISSAHVGLRKPDPAIYKLALSAVENWVRGRGMVWWEESKNEGMSPGDVVFVDDIGENLKAARELGLRTVKVNLGKNRDAVAELEKITGVSLLDEKPRL